MLHERLRRIWDESSDLEEARTSLGELARDLKGRSPELAEWLEEAGEDTLAVFHFPAEHRKRLRTTNGNERINQELLRRTRVVRIFPNTPSLLRAAYERTPQRVARGLGDGAA